MTNLPNLKDPEARKIVGNLLRELAKKRYVHVMAESTLNSIPKGTWKYVGSGHVNKEDNGILEVMLDDQCLTIIETHNRNVSEEKYDCLEEIDKRNCNLD